jgi:hypothetical protein
MDYFQPFDVPPIDSKLGCKDKVLSIGSCFSQEMGSRLLDEKFTSLQHPLGTLYHPAAITQALTATSQDEEKAIVAHQGIYYHWLAHSTIWGNTPEEVKNQYLLAKAKSLSYLEDTDWLIITLGSAISYRLQANELLVANCHKQPQSAFSKHLDSPENILSSLQSMVDSIKSTNSKIRFLFTISPVRHFKDGLIENNQSKAHLITALHQLLRVTKDTYYFPAYELQIDHLRDYRFYKEDLVHPNKIATDMIWEQLKKAWFSGEAKIQSKLWKSLNLDLAHKPLHPGSKPHIAFLEKVKLKLESIQGKYSVTNELEGIQRQLNQFTNKTT